ncbi:dihydroneopterin triphosphate diphosphatase [Agaribacter marinus]|uniref:NUDIX pyrophosphatase n=1 Tax=Agaribacter marinus TaxID=1431249 RepID=A0AA37T1F7_9ALTE|nr:dihydroneopterin triphosphate diphosphatase [Agaribacter marinus]GLR72060.1 NUDIX pyrophosphatase [Agaribacter marinus]
MTLKRPESVLVVIYSEQGRVLMLQRDDDADFWQSITGTMEVGERPIDTAYREVAEEIGLELDISRNQIKDCKTTNQYQIRKRWLHRYPEGTKTNTEHVFSLCICEQTSILLTEHLDFIWLSKHDAIALAWSDTNKTAIDEFVAVNQ